MGECINKQVLINKLQDKLCKLAMPHEVKDRIGEILERFAYSFAIIMVEKENCVDSVEVVRCKDCQYSFTDSFGNATNTTLCRFWTNNVQGNPIVMNFSDYCSYGRKKEVDDSGIHT